MMNATITTAEIREAWMDIQEGKNPTQQRTIEGKIYSWKGDAGDSWQGCTGTEMNGWLQNGYDPEGDPLTFEPSGAEDITTPRIVTDEAEGNLCIDAVLAGEDEYYVRYDETPAPAGISIVAQINMLADTPASVLADYCDFVLRAVDAASKLGGAPALEVQHIVRNVFTQNSGMLDLRIPLVKQGDAVDPTAWRAFVSKASFRTLGFLARGIAADKLGMTLTSGFGASAGPGWSVKRVGDEIQINCPPSAFDFPTDRMEEMLKVALG